MIQVLPAGDFAAVDGRPASVTEGRVLYWRMDDASAQRLIAIATARRTPIAIDYEHQTLKAPENGKPAPAAGFFTRFEWRPGVGLFGAVDWTAAAKAMIAAKEYRYFSPVFSFDRDTGEITELLLGALTNNPALDGMQAITALAAARFQPQPTEEPSMKLTLAAVLAALGLPADTTEEQALAALTARKDSDPLKSVRAALGLADNTEPSVIATACSALKAKAEAVPTVDPAKHVPLQALEDLKREVAALRNERTSDEVGGLVQAGLADGRLLPAQKDWAEQLGKKDVAALRAYLETTPAIAALRSTQTHGVAPVGDNKHNLTADELAVCSALNLTAEEFAKQRATS